MKMEKTKNAIEAILFASGRIVEIKELVIALEISEAEIINTIEEMQKDYETRGIEIVKVNEGYQLVSKKEYYENVCAVLDKRTKPALSNAALEVLSIIAYNPKVTRAEIENIRGVNSDACIYKLNEYNLIEEAGKLDAPGRPMTYKVSNEFFRMFGYSTLDELPELPRYKVDENNQITIEEIEENIESTNIEEKTESANFIETLS